MLVVALLFLLYNTGDSHIILEESPVYDKELIKCVTDIVSKYLAPQKVITYIGNKQADNGIRKAINNLDIVAMFPIRTIQKLPVTNEGYVISATNYSVFAKKFPLLSKEATWNPEARILIIMGKLHEYQLKGIFNDLMKYHVNNVVLVNGTSDAHLYTYNSFENYGCGKRYDKIINFGKCSQTYTQDLFPNKYITEMRNCSLTVGIPNFPPFTLFPLNGTGDNSPLSYGLEPYLLTLVGKMEGFTLNITLNYDTNMYSTVSANMETTGPLKMIQSNEADAYMGGMLLTPSRVAAFDFIHDFLPYVDEIKFLVKQAGYVPPWKNFYLEFDSTVWILIVLALLVYSVIIIFLIRVDDKSLIVYKLLDNLVLHSYKLHYQSTAKSVIIIWIWFTYLINAFYQSSLVSLTTDPPFDNEVLSEADILNHNLKPCFSVEMERYYIESTQSNHSYTTIPGCKGYTESLTTVMNSYQYYTIYMYGYFMYNANDFYDEYGNSNIYSLKKPYSKVLYCMYFYKGFPLIDNIRLRALQLREMGLPDKVLLDIHYKKTIKHYYHAKGYESRFAIPWRVYIFGCSVATITFILELLSKYK